VTWINTDCLHTSISPNGVHAVVGAFYTYAYGPDTFSITANTALRQPSLAYANCNALEIELPMDAAGSVSFSGGAVTPGYNPCLGGGGPVSPSWLEITPLSGTVPPGSNVNLEVTTDAASLTGGLYETDAEILTNDPLASLISLPVSLNVSDAARIAFGTESLDLGSVFVGASASATLTVQNNGTAALDVASAIPGLADYSPDPRVFSVDPGDSAAVVVTFSPPQGGDRSTDLIFGSNDPESPHTVLLIGTGVEPPIITAAPLFQEGAALPGGEKTKTLTLCNTGGSDLTYSVANRPESASPPDGFGHVWFDSDKPGGPVFDWVDVSASGTPIFDVETDDGNAGPFPVGFSFPFYGNTFTEFQICSNGWLSFTNTQANFSNQALPTANSTVPENLLAVLWDDLVFDPSIGSSAYYHHDGNRLVVQFNDLRRFDEMNPPYYSFEVLLYPNGDIVYQYLSVGNDGESATVGIQNAARDDGFQVVHNGPYLHPNLAVRFTVPAAWLGFSPADGTVAPGTCQDVDVIMDASSLGAGDYTGEIFIASNDPQEPAALGGALFHVGSVDPEDCEVSPGTLNAASHGRWINADVELPSLYDPADVVLSTVLMQGTIPADSTFDVIDDYNANGIPDRTFKFDRTAFIMTLPEEQEKVEVVVTGEIRNTIYFTCRDSMRIVRPKILSPDGGEKLLAGAFHEIRWSVPLGWDGTTADLYFSSDQTSWNLMASDIAGNSYLWEVPAQATETAAIKVEIHDEYGMLGFDASDGTFAISTVVTSVGPDPIPGAYALLQNMPNPFSGTTTIRYDLPAEADVTISIFDVSGRSVRRLVERSMPPGRHQTVWNGRNNAGQKVASGIYFYRMRAPQHQETKRLFLLR
jgi:hypothetical protein